MVARRKACGRDLGQILEPVTAEPDALDDLETDLGGLLRHPVEAVFDRIGPDAIGYFGELREIFRVAERCDWSVIIAQFYLSCFKFVRRRFAQ